MSLSDDCWDDLEVWDEVSSTECDDTFEELEESLTQMLAETDSAFDDNCSMSETPKSSTNLVLEFCSQPVKNGDKPEVKTTSEENSTQRDDQGSGLPKKRVLKRPMLNTSLKIVSSKKQKVDDVLLKADDESQKEKQNNGQSLLSSGCKSETLEPLLKHEKEGPDEITLLPKSSVDSFTSHVQHRNISQDLNKAEPIHVDKTDQQFGSQEKQLTKIVSFKNDQDTPALDEPYKDVPGISKTVMVTCNADVDSTKSVLCDFNLTHSENIKTCISSNPQLNTHSESIPKLDHQLGRQPDAEVSKSPHSSVSELLQTTPDVLIVDQTGISVPNSPGEVQSSSNKILTPNVSGNFIRTPIKDSLLTPQHNTRFPKHLTQNLFSSTPLPNRKKMNEEPEQVDLPTMSSCSLNDNSLGTKQEPIEAENSKLYFEHWLENAIDIKQQPTSAEECKTETNSKGDDDEIDEDLEATLLDFSLEVLRDVGDFKTIEVLNKTFGVDQKVTEEYKSESTVTKTTEIRDDQVSKEQGEEVDIDDCKEKIVFKPPAVIVDEVKEPENTDSNVKQSNLCNLQLLTIPEKKISEELQTDMNYKENEQRTANRKITVQEIGTKKLLLPSGDQVLVTDEGKNTEKHIPGLQKVEEVEPIQKKITIDRANTNTLQAPDNKSNVLQEKDTLTQIIPSTSHNTKVSPIKSEISQESTKNDKPKPSYPEENNDLEHPDWEIIKKLNTDEERYKQVRARWRSRDIPDPNQDLTYHAYRKKRTLHKMKHSPVRPPNNPGHKRSATASFSNPPKKRARTRTVPCTYVIDSKIEQVKQEYNQSTNNAVSEFHFQIEAMLQNQVSRQPQDFLQLSQCYRYPFYDSYVNAMSTNMYNAMLMRNEAERNRLVFDHEKRVTEVRRQYDAKLNALIEARNEINKFCSFYKGLNGSAEENDPTVITESQMQELEEIENVYNLFQIHYHNPNPAT